MTAFYALQACAYRYIKYTKHMQDACIKEIIADNLQILYAHLLSCTYSKWIQYMCQSIGKANIEKKD